MQNKDNNAEYLTTTQLARLTHSKEQTWRRRRLTGDGPPFVKWGSRVLYRRADVDQWFADRLRTSTVDPGTLSKGRG